MTTGAPLQAGEHALLAATGPDRRATVVATERALYHQDGGSRDGWRRIGWERVGGVEWDRDHGTLALTDLLADDGPSRTVLRLSGPAALVHLAQEGVRASTLTTARVRIDGQHETVISARRQPGSDQLLWLVSFGPGVDREDPRATAKVEAAIAELRADLGI